MTATRGARPVPVVSTYRLQLSHAFTLRDALEIVPYLSRLGVSHIYSSPLLAARRGSQHGYDVIDHARLNPELGTEDELRALAASLRAHAMGLVLDIVPNHMAASHETPAWMDVLERGESSRFAPWFDIHWQDDPERRVVLPVLGDDLETLLARDDLRVCVTEAGALIAYGDHRFPVNPDSLTPDLQLAMWDPGTGGEAERAFATESGRQRLRALLDVQHYRLVHWRDAPRSINYRRFFDVNDLVGLRVEDPAVFDAVHAHVLGWVADGLIDGLRVDHIDGLWDPVGYLARLRLEVDARASTRIPIVVEKILGPGERLRESWSADGTTGYDFLNEVEEVFIDPAGFDAIERAYRRLRRQESLAFGDVAREGKLRVLRSALAADLDRLARLLLPFARRASHGDWSRDDVAEALAAFIAELEVYRTYLGDAEAPGDADRALLARAAERVGERHRPELTAIAELARDVLLDAPGVDDDDARERFVRRFQQITGPAAAKGVEDTALYRYLPLVSRNEVGGAPDRPLAKAVTRFHAGNAARASRWPRSLIATNTHDTKRSADLRARLDVLSEIPDEWGRSIHRWRRLNARHRRVVRGRLAPDTNTEYLLYQMLVGLWPAPREGRRSDDPPDRRWLEETCRRLQQYALKAAREAKVRTSWTDPDLDVERAVHDFVAAILDPAGESPFATDVSRLVSRIAPAAHWNVMARVALHLTSPGIPDLYQGDELWNISLVDPDNRREVDYDTRSRTLHARAGSGAGEKESSRRSTRMTKLAATNALLVARREHAELFLNGDYRPLSAVGTHAGHVIAFARSLGDVAAVTVAARQSLTLAADCTDDGLHWGDTAVVLPPDLWLTWRSVVGGRDVAVSGDTLGIGALLGALAADCAIGRR